MSSFSVCIEKYFHLYYSSRVQQRAFLVWSRLIQIQKN